MAKTAFASSPLQLPTHRAHLSTRKAKRVCQLQPRYPRCMSTATSAPSTRVCRICKKSFDPALNNPRACRRHPALFTGRLLRVEPTETSGLEFFYDCCGATDVDAPGCEYGFHESYDDE